MSGILSGAAESVQLVSSDVHVHGEAMTTCAKTGGYPQGLLRTSNCSFRIGMVSVGGKQRPAVGETP